MRVYRDETEARRIADGYQEFTLLAVPGGWLVETVYTDLELAKQQAQKDANEFQRYYYVVPVEGGYIVTTYSDIWNAFQDAPEVLAVFEARITQPRRYNK